MKAYAPGVSRQPVWVIGAGGHAKVVIDTLRSSGLFDVAGLLDDDPSKEGLVVLGVAVRGRPSADTIRRLCIDTAVLAIGDNRTRATVAGRLSGLVAWATAIHPRAYLAADAQVGEGTVVCAGAVVQPGTTVGNHVILNSASSVDHDGWIGDWAHVGPGSHLAGNVRVEEGAMLGVGSAVLPGCSVGAWATVGAGAVVVGPLPAGVTAKGIPARYGMPDGPVRVS